MTSRGFTLVETVVGSAIFLLVALSSYKAFSTLMSAVLSSQAKIAATSIANEKFEIMRNLTYTDVGIIGGLPSGKIAKNQTVTRGTYTFNITNTVRSIDDPFDGTIEGSPNDTSPADYKLVDLDITCINCKLLSPLKFTTLFAPRALETDLANGALYIQALNANGIGVSGVSVHIVNTEANPDIVVDDVTDNAGWLRIVDAVPGTNAYNITVTKSGYSQDQTYTDGGVAGLNPIKRDSTVVVQQVTQASFSIDMLSSLTINTVDALCVATPNLGFSLTGTKLIGTPLVLKYPVKNFTTNTLGTYTIQNLEWDTYNALLTSTSYDLAGTTPLPSFSINPNETKTLQMLTVPHLNYALLVSVKDSNNFPIDGAIVTLQKTPFNENKTTGGEVACPTPGQVFWNGLANGKYILTVSKAGYQPYINANLDITSNWQNQTITLIP